MAEYTIDQIQPKVVPWVVSSDGQTMQPLQQPAITANIASISNDPPSLENGINTQSTVLNYDQGTNSFVNSRAPSEQTDLLPSVASSITRTSANQQNNGFTGAIILLNVTAVGGGIISPIINAVESGTGLSFRAGNFFPINVIGQYSLILMPGASDDANVTTRNVSAGPLPRIWNFEVENLTGNSFTYEAGIHLIP